MKILLTILIFFSLWNTLFPQNPEWVKITDERVFNIEETPDSYFFSTDSLYRFDKETAEIEKIHLWWIERMPTELFFNDSILWVCTWGNYYRFKQGNWNEYSEDRTRSIANRVYSMCSDSSGNIWMRRFGSVSKFDGEKYKIIFYGRILLRGDIICNRKNQIWFADDFNDIYRYTDSLELIADTNNLLLRNNLIYSYYLDSNDEMLFCTRNGILKYTNEDTLIFDSTNDKLPCESIVDMVVDQDNNYWLAGNDSIIFVKGEEVIVLDSSVHEFLYDIRGIELDSNNNIYVSCRNGSEILKYDRNIWEVIDLRFHSWNRVGKIEKFILDKENKLWIIDAEGFLFHIYENSKGWVESFLYERIFDYGQSNSIMVDVNNDLWVGSYHGDVVKYEADKTIRYYANDYRLPVTSEQMAKDSLGNLWFASYQGAYKYNNERIERITFCNIDSVEPEYYYEHSYYNASAIAVDRYNNKYFTYSDTLIIYNDSVLNRLQIYDPDIVDNYNDIQIDSENKVWISTGSLEFDYHYDRFAVGVGLFVFNGDTIHHFDTSNSGLPSLSLSNIAIDKNDKKWIGTAGKGIAIYDNDTWSLINAENSELPNDTILRVFIDSYDNKWFATNAGLFVYRKGGVVLGIDDRFEKTENKAFSIFPNPATDYIEIKNLTPPSPIERDFELNIFDVLGQSVLRNTPSSLRDATPLLEGNKRLDVSNLQPGIYFVKINNDFLKFIKL